METNWNATQSKPAETELAETTGRYDGVVIGVLLGFHESGAPLVAFPGNPRETALAARTTTRLRGEDLGHEVALLFENADPARPLLIGVIRQPEPRRTDATRTTADLDGERLVLSAQREIVLKCGKSSITLTRAGKVLIRGAYLLSRSSGINRIKGGSIQVN